MSMLPREPCNVSPEQALSGKNKKCLQCVLYYVCQHYAELAVEGQAEAGERGG